MYLINVSWKTFAIYTGIACALYYTFLLWKYGLLQKLLKNGVKSLFAGSGERPASSSVPTTENSFAQEAPSSYHARLSSRLHNLADEINALLLQANAEKLSRTALLEALIQLLRGQGFNESDVELMASLKEIIIIQASAICDFDYRAEELKI